MFDLLDLVVIMRSNKVVEAALEFESARKNLEEVQLLHQEKSKELAAAERRQRKEDRHSLRQSQKLREEINRHKTEEQDMKKKSDRITGHKTQKEVDFYKLMAEEEEKSDFIALRRFEGDSDKGEAIFAVKEEVYNNSWAAVVLAHMGMMVTLGVTSIDDLHGPNLVFHCIYMADLVMKSFLFRYNRYAIQTGGNKEGMGKIFRLGSVYLYHPYNQRKTLMRRADAMLIVTTLLVALVFEIYRLSDSYESSSETTCWMTAFMGLIFLRLVILMEDLNKYAYSFVMQWDALSNYGILLLTIMYQFTCVFTVLFKEKADQYWGSMQTSMKSLFQMLVGEGWHEIMYATTDAYAQVYQWIFFIYILMVSVVFTQLFIGLIVEMFDGTYQKQAQASHAQTAYGILEHLGTNQSPEDVHNMVSLLKRVHWIDEMKALTSTLHDRLEYKVDHLLHPRLSHEIEKESDAHWQRRFVRETFFRLQTWSAHWRLQNKFHQKRKLLEDNRGRLASRPSTLGSSSLSPSQSAQLRSLNQPVEATGQSVFLDTPRLMADSRTST